MPRRPAGVSLALFLTTLAFAKARLELKEPIRTERTKPKLISLGSRTTFKHALLLTGRLVRRTRKVKLAFWRKDRLAQEIQENDGHYDVFLVRNYFVSYSKLPTLSILNKLDAFNLSGKVTATQRSLTENLNRMSEILFPASGPSSVIRFRAAVTEFAVTGP